MFPPTSGCKLDTRRVDGRCLGNDINPIHAAGLQAGTQISSLQRLLSSSSSSSTSSSSSSSASLHPSVEHGRAGMKGELARRNEGEPFKLSEREEGEESDGGYRGQVKHTSFFKNNNDDKQKQALHVIEMVLMSPYKRRNGAFCYYYAHMQKTMHPHLTERQRLQLHACSKISVH